MTPRDELLVALSSYVIGLIKNELVRNQKLYGVEPCPDLITGMRKMVDLMQESGIISPEQVGEYLEVINAT